MPLTSLPDASFPSEQPEQTELNLPAPINIGNDSTQMPYWIRPANLFQKREMILNPPKYIKIHVAWSSPIDQNSEKFWLKVVATYRLWMDCVVANELKGADRHHIKFGDVMRISPDEVFEVIQ
jgi:hypothetical protein